MIAERPDGTDRVAGGRRSLSSAGEARWRLRRRRPIEKRGEEGSERSGEISASLSARVAPGLHPALSRNPSALSGATHHRAGHRAPIYTRAAALSRLSIYPSSADESEGSGLPGKVEQPPLLPSSLDDLSCCRSFAQLLINGLRAHTVRCFFVVSVSARACGSPRRRRGKGTAKLWRPGAPAHLLSA